MTPNDIAAAAERVSINQAENRQSFPDDYMVLALAYLAEKRERELTFEVTHMADIERAIRGHKTPGRAWPDWVYEARAAVKHMGENPPPWLADLHAILGWQGGTVHAALKAVQRLVAVEEERVKERDAKAAKQKFADFLDKRYEGYRP